jgi:hypothetical protein
MRNVAGCAKNSIERTFDMKGSTNDRMVINPRKKAPDHLNKIILKDIDFLKLEEKIYVNSQDARRLLNALIADANFFRSCGLIDYSIILFKVIVDASETEAALS